MQVERPSGKFRARWAQLSLLPWRLVLLSRVCPKTRLVPPISSHCPVPTRSVHPFLLLVRIAAPIAIVYKTKTRNARTTFLNSSAYLVVLGLPAFLLNRLHLECVSESGCSSLCQLHSKNDRTHTFNRQQVYLQPLLC